MKPHKKNQLNFKYRFGSFELDPQDTTPLRLLRDGQPCKIQPKQFDLLVCFVEKPKQPISYEELIWEVWGLKPCPEDETATDSRVNNLQKQIGLLRDVIGDDMITGQRGCYCFVADVSREPSKQEPEGAFENLTFQWILNAPETRTIEIFFIFLIGLSSLYLVMFGLRPDWLPRSLQQDPRLVVSVIQFIVIAVAFIASISIFKHETRVFPESASRDRVLREASGYADPEEWLEAKRSAKESLERYVTYWQFFLATWTLVYLVMIGRSLRPPEYVLDILRVAASLFSNFNSLAIALCFVVLNHPTVFGKDGSRPNLDRVRRPLEIFGTLGIVLVAVSQGSIVVAFGLTGNSAKYSFLTLEVIGAFFGGVALALFVGRVQSKFLGPSTWLPLVMYVYVGLQTFFVVIDAENHQLGVAVLIEAALVLKCILFLFVIWLFRSGRFLFYFVRVKKIYERVNPDWKAFFLNLDRHVKE
jgi:DNA-binding winged helix-turn-helix (wHTH) protein